MAAWIQLTRCGLALIMDIVNYALRRLRYKLEYTAVGFELSLKFTLSNYSQHMKYSG
jgi:hypothetical protein